MIEERERKKCELVIKLKNMRISSSISYNDRFVMELNFSVELTLECLLQ